MPNLPHDTHVLALLPAYAIGSLDADEIQHVEEHLLSCWICRNESSAFQTVADELSFAAPAAAPSVELKDRLMQRVQSARSKGWQRISPPRQRVHSGNAFCPPWAWRVSS
jgi:hypothetical protein